MSETIWVADSGQDRVFAYNIESGDREEGLEFELAEGHLNPRGMWSDGETMYALGSLFVYDLETGAVVAEYQLDKLNSSPRGIWSDGVTIWVSDDGAKRIFAYGLVEDEEGAGVLQREEALEFTFRSLLKAGNSNPRGIWSDGDTMYVVDEQDDKIYSYNMPDAIIAQLASLSLSGIEFGEFTAGKREYTATVEAGRDQTTVAASALVEGATITIAPDDADDDPENGHQVGLEGLEAVVVTVTSPDGNRTKVYRIQLNECLSGLSEAGLSPVVFGGGSMDELLACARSLDIDALYHQRDGSWVAYFFDAPAFLNQPFRNRFAQGPPTGGTLLANRQTTPTAAPADGG